MSDARYGLILSLGIFVPHGNGNFTFKNPNSERFVDDEKRISRHKRIPVS